MGEEDRCPRVMGDTFAMKRLLLLESVLLERGRVVVSLYDVLDPEEEMEPISFSGCCCCCAKANAG